MNTLTVAALIAGSVFGTAVALLVWQVRPATPALGPALARLRGEADQPSDTARTLTAWTDRLIPHTGLAVIGRTRRDHLSRMGMAGLAGLAMPALLSFAVSMLGWTPPWALPVLAGVGLAGGFMIATHREVGTDVARAQEGFRVGVCTYIDQVALLSAAGHGPVECLERAAVIGDGVVFDRIRATLAQSRSQPWDRLRELGQQLGVPALGDLGDIMDTSGSTGTQVYRTLRAKTAALRSQIRFDDLAAAKATNTALDGIGAGVVLVLLLIAVFPFLAQLYLM